MIHNGVMLQAKILTVSLFIFIFDIITTSTLSYYYGIVYFIFT